MASNPPDPWAEFNPQPLNGAAPVAPSYPGVIQGPPVVPTPLQIEANNRANVSQGIAIQANERAGRGEERSNRQLGLQEAAAARAAEEAQRGTVDQNRAAGLLRRAINAQSSLSEIGDIGARSLPGQAFRDAFPNASNYITDPTRQRAEQAEKEFIGAILRYDSGAAIPDNEYITNGLIYFPRPGDSPEVIRQKEEARRVAVEGLLQAAGPAGQRAWQAMQDGATPPVTPPAGANPGSPTPSPTGDARAPTQQDTYAGGVVFGMDQWGQENAFDRNAYLAEQYGLQGDQEAQTIAFWNKNRGNAGLTVDNARQWYADNGIRPPTDADLQTAVDEARSGRGFAGISTTDAENRYTRQLDQVLQQEGVRPEDVSNTVGLNAAQGVSFGFGDEIAGIGGGIEAALNGGDAIGGYQIRRDLVRRQQERSREARPITSLASELGGGLVTGGVGFGNVRTAGQAFRAGATMGALSGFGYGEGLGGSVIGAGVGGALGGPLAAGTQAIAPTIVSALGRVARRQPRTLDNGLTPTEMLQAADDLNVPLMAADVGGAGARMASGMTSRTLGGIPMAEAANASNNAARVARDTIADNVGRVTDRAGAGQAIERGQRAFESTSTTRANELFNNIPIANDTQASLAQTRNALNEITRGMGSNPDLSRLWAANPKLRATLEALTPNDPAPAGRQAFIDASERLTRAHDAYQIARSRVGSPQELNAARNAVDQATAEVRAAQAQASAAPTGGQLTWQDMKDFRSSIGEVIGRPAVTSDGSDIEDLRKLYAALSSDMEVTAAQAGPRALTQFNRANQYFRGRASRLEEVFTGLLGNNRQRGDEDVFNQINRWAQDNTGDFKRLSRTIRSLPRDEADTVRATIISRLGQARPGQQQGEAAEVFSPATFATQWQSLAPRAKNVLFPNPGHRADLEKLARLSEGMRGASQFANFSNTTAGANALVLSGSALGSPGTAVAMAAMQYGAGMAMASQWLTRWIAQAPRIRSPAALQRHIQKLDGFAARSPQYSEEVEGLKESLTGIVDQATAGQ